MSADIIVRTTLMQNEASPLKIPRISQTNESPFASQNLEVIKKISKGRFPVYLTSSKINREKYVMKVFSDFSNDSSECYENELRFASLDHRNIIKTVDYEKDRTLVQKGIFMRVTYVLSEYAPYGDFFDFLVDHNNKVDDKLARTYFRQLINGLEYLHFIGIAHLDLKSENLLIGSDFNLKIADFDLSYATGDDRILSRGTRYYRAPELYNSSSSNIELADPFAADIYSAGIILFILKCGGVYPHAENRDIEGVNFTELMHKNHHKFWSSHCNLQEKDKSFFDSNFKDLFHKMVKADPKKRASIKRIKQTKWYNGPIYTPQELAIKMKTILHC